MWHMQIAFAPCNAIRYASGLALGGSGQSSSKNVYLTGKNQRWFLG
jgi:pantothenate synthetase